MTNARKGFLTLLAVVCCICAAAGIVLYHQWWVPNQKISDLEWMNTASKGELKEVAHRVLTCPVGRHHDAFLLLSGVGDVESIPYLLAGLRWKPYTGKGDMMPCTKMHCLDALRRITGHDAGMNYSDWAEWWASTGSKIPPTAFPLDQHPPEPSDR